MKLEKDQLRREWDSDRKRSRRRVLLAVLLAAAVFVVCLGFLYEDYQDAMRFAPLRYYHSLLVHIGIRVSAVYSGTYWHERENLIAEIGEIDYVGSIYRLKLTAMAAVAGAGLAAAGAVFQTIYRNPMASPNMLGATAGVQLGNVIMVMMFSGEAAMLIGMRYRLCYALTAVCVGVILLLGRLSGDRRGNPSVLKMVMAGSILNQGLGTFAMYYMYHLSEEDLMTYQEISMGTQIDVSRLSLIIFFSLMGVSLIPLILLRYRYNVVGIDDAEARAAGVNPAPYRLFGQIFGVVMTTAAMIHCGEAGMLAMVMPYIMRNRVGSDFRKVFTYSALFGAALMMACRTLSTSVPLRNSYGDVLLDANLQTIYIPATFIINICLLPFFMMILARQRSTFE
ncbi:MAG: iron ABC transporter permease [Lachnospiraceae bacterium]|nr:iron ABC transporter permease [Lachnospiraceae bacterium]